MHYYYDYELFEDFRIYFRGRWAVDRLLKQQTNKPTESDDSNSSVSAMSSAGSFSPEDLKLRVWGARAPFDFPILDSLPPPDEMEVLLSFEGNIWDEETKGSYCESPQTSFPGEIADAESHLASCVAEVSVSSRKSSCALSLTGSASSSIEPSFALSPRPKAPMKVTPIIFDEIWSILMTRGFKYSNGYRHPSFKGKVFDTSSHLAKFLYWNPIPGGNWNPQERVELRRWLSFAFVEVKHSQLVSQVKRLSEPEITKILSKLGFEILPGGLYVRPGAREVPKIQHQIGIHKFNCLEDVRSFIRGSGDIRISGISRSARREPTVDKKDLLALRIWAAESSQSIPFFDGEGDVADITGTESLNRSPVPDEAKVDEPKEASALIYSGDISRFNSNAAPLDQSIIAGSVVGAVEAGKPPSNEVLLLDESRTLERDKEEAELFQSEAIVAHKSPEDAQSVGELEPEALLPLLTQPDQEANTFL